MLRLLWTVFVLLIVCFALAAVNVALGLGDLGYLCSIFVALMLVSLTDRERFWAMPPKHER